MSVYDMWTVCDRCGFNYKRRDVRREQTNFLVCKSCHDGEYDLKAHPQNYSARPRRELRMVPNARPDQTKY